MSEIGLTERNRQMEDAFEEPNVPALAPAGPQMVTIEDRPSGAMKVAVERHNGKVLAKLKAIAASAGDDFFYRWPVNGRDGKKDWVEGPSVKCTNAVAREFGNCTVKVRAFDQGAHWMIQAQFVDLQTGYVLERPFQQRKGQNIGGKMDKDRALDMVFQIGVSKATRNVVCNALSEFVDYAFAEAKDAIVGRVGKELEKYRGRVNSRLQELKVPVDRVEAQIGKPIDKWLAPDVARVIAEIQSVSDGMADADEMWPPKEFGQPRPQENQQVKDQAGQQGGGQQPAAQAKADAPKATETAKPAAKAEAPKPEPSQDEDAVSRQVTTAIAQAAIGDKKKLDELDDQVCAVTDREGREDQRTRWNDAYLLRKNELRSGHTGPSALLAAEEEAPTSQGSDLADWFAGMKRDLDACTSGADVDVLEEKVAAELVGDQGLADEWKALCAAKFREVSRRRR